jgi:hypothetical protein
MTRIGPWEEVDSAMSGNFEAAIDLLVRLAESAESPSDVGNVGAGPLYSFINFNLGALKDPKSDLVRQLDEASRRSGDFRTALGDVWYYSEEVPPDVRDRIAGFPPPLDERFPAR